MLTPLGNGESTIHSSYSVISLYLFYSRKMKPRSIMVRKVNAEDSRLFGGEGEGEGDYIEMDITALASPPKSVEFEFHLSTVSDEMESVSSPADELFYRGKLLPLHLPPRLEMVEEILTNVNNQQSQKVEEIVTSVTDVNTKRRTDEFVDPKKTWSDKLRLKMKASKVFLRYLLFSSKPACSDHNNEMTSGCLKIENKNSLCQIKGENEKICKEQKVVEQEEVVHQRRSFYGAIHHQIQSDKISLSSESSICSFSSPSSSSMSNMVLKPQLQRSNSLNSDLENIQGAIAHCKNSMVPGRNSCSI